MNKPSKRLIEALMILRDKKPRSFAYFGELFWPDNPMHQRHSNAGTHGSRRGAGSWRCAGGYLGKLRKKGLVRDNTYSQSMVIDYGIYSLTNKGREVLNEYEGQTGVKS